MTFAELVRDELRRRSGVADLELVCQDGAELRVDNADRDFLVLTAKFKKKDGSDWYVCNGADEHVFIARFDVKLDEMAVRIKHEAAT